MYAYELGEKNKYYNLYLCIRKDILSGKIKKGEKLAGKRTLAKSLGISVVTVQNAYEQLMAEGYVSAKERSGYYVEDFSIEYHGEKKYQSVETNEKPKYKLDFVGGSAPSTLFPFSTWSKIMRSVLADCGEHLLERVSSCGDYELRKAISEYLYRSRGISAEPERIIIGAGAESLYGMIVQLLGRNRFYGVENPCYSKIPSIYKLNGAKCVYLDVEQDGVNVDQLVNCKISVLHISPSHQFPTGIITPAYKRAKIINWSEKGDRFIIEDDYDSEFRLFGKPLQSTYSLRPDKVIYLNTFSKTLAPSMRIGYAVLPNKLYEKYLQVFGKFACTVPLFEQKTLAKMIDGGYFERHVNRLKNHYREIQSEIYKKFESLKDFKIIDNQSGLHFVVKFNGSDEELKKLAYKKGINVKCLSDYAVKDKEKFLGYAVINYSSVTSESLKEFK